MNNEEVKEYLPIGTIVLLKNVKIALMIIGYKAVRPEDKNIVYDYLGCVATVGIKSLASYKVFNKDQIEKVLYYGYRDEEWDELKGIIETK